MPPGRAPEPAGEKLYVHIKACKTIEYALVFSECRAGGGELLVAIQGEIELPRFLGQAAGQEEGIAEAVPRLPVLGVLRQAALEVGDRLLRKVAGFVNLGTTSAPSRFPLRGCRGWTTGGFRGSLRSLMESRSFKSAAVIWSGVVFRWWRMVVPEKQAELIGGARGELFISFRIATRLGKPRAFGFGLVQEHEQTHDSRGQGHRQREQEARDGRVPAAPSPGVSHRGDAAGLDRTTFEPEAQVAGQGLGGSVASVRGFFQAREADRLEVAGNPAVEPARGDGVLVADLVERLRARRSLKGRTACQQVVQERAQGMEIGGGPDRAGKGGHLLGGHVGRGPLGAVGPGLGRARLAFEAGDAEVGNLGGDECPRGLPARRRAGCSTVSDRGGTTPRVWKYPTARAMVSVSRAASRGGSGSVNRSLSVPPDTYSRTSHSHSSVSSTRWIATTWSCGTRESAALRRASARAREDRPASSSGTASRRRGVSARVPGRGKPRSLPPGQARAR